MILVDVNLLLYASFNVTRFYDPARHWLDAQLNGPERVGLPWASLLGFMRLAANRHAVKSPVAPHQAWSHANNWLSVPGTWIPQPTDRHMDILGELLALPGMGGNLIPDAHLAALAMEHGLTLCSTDGDFARFPKLRWENPLA